MLKYRPAREEQYDEFLQLTWDQAADYLETTLKLMQMDWEQAQQLFRTVGEIYGI